MIEIIISIYNFLVDHFYNRMLVLRPIYNNVIKYLSFFFFLVGGKKHLFLFVLRFKEMCVKK